MAIKLTREGPGSYWFGAWKIWHEENRYERSSFSERWYVGNRDPRITTREFESLKAARKFLTEREG